MQSNNNNNNINNNNNKINKSHNIDRQSSINSTTTNSTNYTNQSYKYDPTVDMMNDTQSYNMNHNNNNNTNASISSLMTEFEDESHTAESVSPFIRKTFQMVSDDATNETCEWDATGTSFVVRNEELFSNTILPRYFRHKNFSSFVRQLNFYGFHKRSINQRIPYVKFTHKYFQRGRPDLLSMIKRKPTEQTTNFKIQLDMLTEKYNALEHNYNDLQYTLKNMLYIFARYMSQHGKQNISPHELNDRIAELHGKVNYNNQLPVIDQSYLHKRPRLMLNAADSENNNNNTATNNTRSTALSQYNQQNDDAELYQQILHLTERLGNMPHGPPTTTQQQYRNNQSYHQQQHGIDEYDQDDNDHMYDSNTAANYDNIRTPSTTNRVFNTNNNNNTANLLPAGTNIPIPANIELIEDDDLSPTMQQGNNNNRGKRQYRARRNNRRSRTTTNSPSIKQEGSDIDASSVSVTSSPILNNNGADTPPLNEYNNNNTNTNDNGTTPPPFSPSTHTTDDDLNFDFVTTQPTSTYNAFNPSPTRPSTYNMPNNYNYNFSPSATPQFAPTNTPPQQYNDMGLSPLHPSFNDQNVFNNSNTNIQDATDDLFNYSQNTIPPLTASQSFNNNNNNARRS